MQRTRWQEGIVNLRQQTCDGWILQSKQFRAKNHTEEIFAHKLALVCRHYARKEMQTPSPTAHVRHSKFTGTMHDGNERRHPKFK